MTRLFFAAVTLPMALIACTGEPDPNAKEVDDFAARIGGNQQATKPAEQAQTAAPNSAPAPVEPAKETGKETGEATQPPPSNCGAPKIAPFYGRNADQPTRAAVMAAVAPQDDVRFIEAGSNFAPDPVSKRLNVMVDATGAIRDARCG